MQLVDEVIRRADLCFRSEAAGIAAEKLAVFDQAKKAWKTAAARFGPEGEKFEAGLPLVDDRVVDPATDAFGRIPAGPLQHSFFALPSRYVSPLSSGISSSGSRISSFHSLS